ncbi:restriction endonuclease subunit S [Enterococcus faecalis]|uniref:restriction endonuclease subunit S n=1 Tax=Enterococcus faecalis TaxID=1351 RepID=UPI003D6A12F0
MKYKVLTDFTNGSGSYGIAASAVEKSESLPTYLRITDIYDDGTLNLDGLKSVDDPKSSNYFLQPNDIVFARTGGSTGRNYFYDGTDGEFVYAGFLIKFSIDPQKCNPKFIKYYCQSQEYKDWVQSFNTGSTRGNINAKTFGNMPIPDFSRTRQDLLVNSLSVIDDRIAENKKINHHLTELLQVNLARQLESVTEKSRIGNLTLTVSDHVANGSFKSLKENVELVENPDFALFLRNVDLKNNLNGGRRYVTKSSYDFLKKSRLYGHEVIISNVADVGSVHRVPKMNMPMVAGNNVVFLQAENGLLTDYLYVYFNSRFGQHDIASITSGSAQQKFNKTDFRNLEVPILPDEIIKNEITPLLRFMDNNNGEISRLMDLRDALLPKLMSGETSIAR